MEKTTITPKTVKKKVASKKPVVSSAQKTTEVKESMTAPHFNLKGEKERVVSLPDSFGMQVNSEQIAQGLRVMQINQRQGTASTKTRGEVGGSTRKIYRQKGTGRARHGSIKAPIFVGGGIAFGPHPRDFDAKMPRKMRRQVTQGLLSQKVNEGKVSVVTGLGDASGKTKEIVALIDKMGMHGKKLLLVVDSKQNKAVRAARNIEGVMVRPMTSFSALDITRVEQVVFAKEALDTYKKTGGAEK